VKDFDSFVDRRTANFTAKSDNLFSKVLNNTKGQAWKDLRSTLSPTFTTGKLRSMYPLFTNSAKKMGEYLWRQIQADDELDFEDVMTRFTMDVIASAAFGLNPHSFAPVDSEFTKCALRFQGRYASKWSQFKLVVSMYFPKVFQLFRIPLTDPNNGQYIVDIIKNTIKQREETGERREDFLQLLMDARDPSANTSHRLRHHAAPADESAGFEKDAEIKSPVKKVALTEDLVLAQSMLFFFGGFSGLEVLMRMTCYEISINSTIQDTLYKEIRLAADKNNGVLSYEIVMHAEYLDKVISEALRKWPSSTRLERMSTKPYVFPEPNKSVAKDTMVLIPVYGLHHDERNFDYP